MIKKLRASCAITPEEEAMYNEGIEISEMLGLSPKRFQRGLAFRKRWPILSLFLFACVDVWLQLKGR